MEARLPPRPSAVPSRSRLRQQEGLEALRDLGYLPNVYFLGFPDRKLAAVMGIRKSP